MKRFDKIIINIYKLIKPLFLFWSGMVVMGLGFVIYPYFFDNYGASQGLVILITILIWTFYLLVKGVHSLNEAPEWHIKPRDKKNLSI